MMGACTHTAISRKPMIKHIDNMSSIGYTQAAVHATHCVGDTRSTAVGEH
jgi:hypothetical protein